MNDDSLLGRFKNEWNVYDVIDISHPRRVRQHRDGSFELEGGCSVCPECYKARSPLTIAGDGKRFFCRKYQRGGGVVEALALTEGVISCNQLGKVRFSKEQWRDLFDAIRMRM